MSYQRRQRDDKNPVLKQEPIPIISVPNTSVPNTEFVYYTGNYTNTTNRLALAEYNDSRTDPIVDRASDYKLALVKFNIRTDYIPMFYNNEKTFIIYFYYRPDNILISQPIQQNSLPTYSQEEFISRSPDSLNEGFVTGFNALITAYEAIHGAGTWTSDPLRPQVAPGMQFQPGDNLFTMFVDERSITGATYEIEYYFSFDLARLFTGLPQQTPQTFTTPSLPYGSEQYYFGYNTTHSNIAPIPGATGYNFVSSTTIYDCTGLWYEISRIIITSNNLATRRNYIGVGSGGQSNVELPIITDFTFVTDNGPQNNPTTWYEYQPSGPYRWIDIFGDNAVNKINLQFYYATANGVINPLFVLPGDSYSFTLLFARIVL